MSGSRDDFGEKMKGKQITSLKELIAEAKAKRSIVADWRCFGPHRRLPAAFIVNWQGTIIQRLLDEGAWLYEKDRLSSTMQIVSDDKGIHMFERGKRTILKDESWEVQEHIDEECYF